MSVRDLIILGCSSQQPTRHRNQGAYLVRWNGEGFLFDPGEGTQRQCIFANVAPPTINRIFISHFHGDHCLGLGSMLMRLNIDQVTHPIHCYYPASGQRYFDRLRFGTIYHQNITVIEHPVYKEGIVEETEAFRIEARFLDHGVDNLGWRITEADQRKFNAQKLAELGVKGPMVADLLSQKTLFVNGRNVSLDEVSVIRKGDSLAIVIDTRPCAAAYDLAKGAKLLLCEATYLSDREEMAHKHHHMTAKQAAMIASTAKAELLVLTHYSARYPDSRPFEQEAKSIFPNTIAAEDLMVIPFPK
ncbi:MAG: ribonuclease Z [Verrucomicrobia bacterium]|nr:ribonuclease Z [Verrucomicrobiota bacterium]